MRIFENIWVLKFWIHTWLESYWKSGRFSWKLLWVSLWYWKSGLAWTAQRSLGSQPPGRELDQRWGAGRRERSCWWWRWWWRWWWGWWTISGDSAELCDSQSQTDDDDNYDLTARISPLANNWRLHEEQWNKNNKNITVLILTVQRIHRVINEGCISTI